MAEGISRRQFVAGTVAVSAGTVMGLGASHAAEPVTPAPGSQNTLPTGRIGKLTVSRLLLGGNQLTHYTHSRDLSYVYNLAAHYNTEEKILETMAVAEANGVNTLVIHTADNVMNLLKRYRNERGGKIQWIVCPTAPIEPGLAAYTQQVRAIVDDGVDAIYLWGVRADALVQAGQIDLMAQAVEVARSAGVPSGVGAHELAVIRACEENKVNTDFYLKTLHHHNYPSFVLNHDSSWCAEPEATIELMKSVEKPWLAFKVMAAGAIPPEDAFRYAFTAGADFCLAGMFDYEVAPDVATVNGVLAGLPQRVRPWRG